MFTDSLCKTEIRSRIKRNKTKTYLYKNTVHSRVVRNYANTIFLPDKSIETLGDIQAKNIQFSAKSNTKRNEAEGRSKKGFQTKPILKVLADKNDIVTMYPITLGEQRTTILRLLFSPIKYCASAPDDSNVSVQAFEH